MHFTATGLINIRHSSHVPPRTTLFDYAAQRVQYVNYRYKCAYRFVTQIITQGLKIRNLSSLNNLISFARVGINRLFDSLFRISQL